jgi:flagellar biosynthesis/type III secretory pathway protein FliH
MTESTANRALHVAHSAPDAVPERARIVRDAPFGEIPYRPARYVRGPIHDAEVVAQRILAQAEVERAAVHELRLQAEQAGLAAARAGVESVIAALNAERASFQDRFVSEVLAASSALVSALLNTDEHFYDEAIASLAGSALAAVRMERSITIRASPRAAPWLESLRDDLLRSLVRADEIDIVADPTLDSLSIRIDSEHGAQTFSVRTRLRRLRREARRASISGVRAVPANEADDAPLDPS